MAQNDQKYRTGVHETCTSPPTGSNDINLSGAVSPYRTFNDAYNPGDKFTYYATNSNGFEIAEGTFQQTPDRIERNGDVYESSNGGALENFSGGGTLDVVACVPPNALEDLVGDVQTTGLIRRTGEHTYSEEDLTFANGGFTPIISLSGASNTDITQLFEALNSDGDTMTDTLSFASAANRPLELNISAGTPKYFTGSVAGDRWLEIEKSGVDDYLLYTNTGGAKRRLLTADGSDNNDADTLGGTTPANHLRWISGEYVEADFGLVSTLSDGVNNSAHGFNPSVPRMVWGLLRCTTTQHNYSVGDEIPIGVTPADQIQGSHGIHIVYDATNIGVVFDTTNTQIWIKDKTTGGNAQISNGSWKIIVRAIK